MKLRWLALFALVTCQINCTEVLEIGESLEYLSCNTNTDCPCDSLCSNGSCRAQQSNVCQADADCAQGQVCQVQNRNGQACNYAFCVPSNSNPNACTTDDQCGCGAACVSGMCFQPQTCQADCDCAQGDVCREQNRNGQACNYFACVPGNNTNPCTTDSECACGAECLQGGCHPRQACMSNTDCAQGEVCREQNRNGQACNLFACEPGNANQCQADADCACGFYCTNNGACWQYTTCNQMAPCAQGEVCDYQTRNGQACNIGVCVPNSNPNACMSDADCACGLSCTNGVCLQTQGCSQNTQCPQGEVCQEQVRNGQTCSLFECVPNSNPNACQADSDCPCGTYCDGQSNVCYQYRTCNQMASCPQGETCEYQNRNGQACNVGVCVPNSNPNACMSDDECPCAAPCINGICLQTATCQTNTDCQQQGDVCEEQVRNGQSCNYYACVPGNGNPTQCMTSADCPCTNECSANNVCVQAQQCQQGGCPMGQNCQEQYRNNQACNYFVCQ